MLFPDVDRSIPPSFDYDAFDLPENVSMNFVLSIHDTAADLPEPNELNRLVKSSDGLIFELVGADAPIHDFMNRISDGKSADYKKLIASKIGEWNIEFLKATFASRVPITTMDVRQDEPCRKPFLAGARSLELLHNFSEPKPDTAPAYREALLQFYSGVKARDQLLLSNIAPAIESLESCSRKFASKREQGQVSIGVFYGIAHRSLFDALMHKAGTEPVHGFDTSLHPSGDIALSGESVYAHYLRTNDVSLETATAVWRHNRITTKLRESAQDQSKQSTLDLWLQAEQILLTQ